MRAVERYLRERYILALSLFIAFSFFINFKILFNSFSVDDFVLIVHNPFVWDIKNLFTILLPENFFNMLPIRLGARPLFVAALIGQFHFFKFNPLGYHFVSIAVHTINALMVFAIALKLKRYIVPAALAACCFAFSPVMLETVAVISFQSYVFSTFLCLGAAYFFLLAVKSGKTVYYFLCFAAVAEALLLKENSVIMPLVCAAYALVFEARGKKPFVITAAVCAITALFFVYFWLPRFPTPIFSAVYPNMQNAITPVVNFYAYLNNIGASFLHNIKNLLLPFNLSVDYTLYVSGKSLSAAVIFAALLSSLAYAIFKVKDKTIKFLMAFVVLAYLPVSNIVPLINTVSDRYLYFIMAPMALLLGAGLCALRRKKFYKYAVIILAFIILAWAFCYRARTQVFLNNQTIYADVIKKYPQNVRAHYNLAVSYMGRGMFDKALEHLNKVSRINKFYKSADVLFLTGECFWQLGNVSAAREYILKSAMVSGENQHVEYFFSFFNSAEEAMKYIVNKVEKTNIDKKTFSHFVNYYNSVSDKKYSFNLQFSDDKKAPF